MNVNVRSMLRDIRYVLFSFLLLGLLGSSNALAGVIALEGTYQGKNLYVQNPFAGSGVGFCTYEVTVNGDVTTDEINSSAFEVDLSNFDLKIGDEVVVKIKHKDDCKPKVLNPEVLKPKSTYEIQNIEILEEDSVLKWTTKGETGQLPFIIQQYRWNKWVRVGEVQGKGNPKKHTYKFKFNPHSGENKFRVIQEDYTGKVNPSKSVSFRNTEGEELQFSPKKVKKEIIFTGETKFEIYDQYGNVVKKGYGKKVNVKNLKDGVYYLSYDNKTEKFIKK